MYIEHNDEVLTVNKRSYVIRGWTKWVKERGDRYELDDYQLDVTEYDENEVDPDVAAELLDKFLDQVDVDWYLNNSEFMNDENKYGDYL